MSQAGKGHVPEENLTRYRQLASVARQFNTVGNHLSNLKHHVIAEEVWEMSKIYWDEANSLRVDLPTK